MPSVGRKISPGRKRASTDACRIVSFRTASARSAKRSRTSSSRPNACTISIPTTTSSEASVRWPFLRCTSREIGNTRCAKKYVRTAIGGITRAAVSASFALTVARTIAAPAEHQDALDRLHDAPADEVPDGVDVVRRAADHLTGRVAVVERAREAQVRVVELRAEPRLDRDADARSRVAAREVDAEAERRGDQDRDEVRDEQRVVVAVDRVVDRALDDDRDEKREPREHERAGEPDRGEAPLGPPERVQVPDRRPELQVGRVDVVHGRAVLPALVRPGSSVRSRPRSRGRGRAVRRALAASRTTRTVVHAEASAGAVFRPFASFASR